MKLLEIVSVINIMHNLVNLHSNQSSLLSYKNEEMFYNGSFTKINTIHIRASVDALCRDGTSEISRDPRTKRLQTRRESLARPSKHTNNNF